MEKPERKTNFKVTKKVNNTSVSPYIVFWCCGELLDNVKGLGNIKNCGGDKWMITVDPRYDFDEVARYFDNLEASQQIN